MKYVMFLLLVTAAQLNSEPDNQAFNEENTVTHRIIVNHEKKTSPTLLKKIVVSKHKEVSGKKFNEARVS